MKARLIPGLALGLLMASTVCGRSQDAAATKPPSTDGTSPAVSAQAPASAPQGPISIPTLTRGPVETGVPLNPPPVPVPPAPLSVWTQAIIKMGQSGVDEHVLITYIDSAGTFNLGADEIVYLRDLGFSNKLIVTMLRHDSDIISGARPVPATAPPGVDSGVGIANATSAANAPAESAQPAEIPAAPPAPQSEVPAKIDSAPTPVAAAPATPETSRAQNNQIVYPVREPYPVELVPPFTVVGAPPPERPLTTVTIRMFP